VRAALDRGVTLFNSANIYTGGEELLARAFKGRPRESYCIATKFGIKLPEFVPDLRREAVLEACDAALARLGTTYIDLFIVCRMQTSVPLEETMGALKELVAAGKIRAVGLSEASAAQIKLAHSICPLTAVEVEYSVWERSIEEEVLPMCRKLGIAVLAYSPLGRGFLTGAIQSPNDVSAPGPFMGRDFRAICPRFADQDGAFATNKALVDRLAAVAAKKGVTTAQIALAWVHAQGADIFPIPGTTKLANLEDNIAAAAVQLTPEELAAIEAAVPPAEVVGTRYHAHGMAMCFESMPALNEEK
jgi:aryl-alcohol dehydrogenase-like predicted oxidoreductase